MTKGTERLVGLAVGSLAGLLLARRGAVLPMDFDEYWHVFVASQDDWSNFRDEVMTNTHPPLFHLLLRLVMGFGYTPLKYRAVSILAAVGSMYLVGRIVRRMGAPFTLSLIASLAFGLSSSAMSIALDVRSYMLCTFFVLLAFLAYLPLIDHAFDAADGGERATFALGTSLAIASHYSAVFFLAAALAAPIAYGALARGFRRRLAQGFRARWAATFATFALPVVTASVFLSYHAQGWYGRLGHLSTFLFSPDHENAAAFVVRQMGALLQLFFPFSVDTPGSLVVAMSTIVAAVAMALSRGEGSATVRRMPVLFASLIVVCLAVGGLLQRYPFGGLLRHQFIVFPFLCLSVFAGVIAMANVARRHASRLALIALAGLAVALNAIAAVRAPQALPDRPGEREIATFRRTFPKPPAVYVDQFSLIAFFMRHDDWNWRFVRAPHPHRRVDVWRLSRNGERIFVCRDRDTWVMNLTEAGVYRKLGTCLRRTGAESVALFGLEQRDVITPLPSGIGGAADTIRDHAAQEGLLARDITVDGHSVYARFQLATGNTSPQ